MLKFQGWPVRIAGMLPFDLLKMIQKDFYMNQKTDRKNPAGMELLLTRSRRFS